MKIVKLSETLSVSEQITAQDIEEIASAGFKVVVNNRPDGESPNQPPSDEIARAVQAAGLSYYYLPITAHSFPGPDVNLITSLFDNPEAPVMAFCRSGTRCANLWVATRATQQLDSAAAHAKALGYDLAMSTLKKN